MRIKTNFLDVLREKNVFYRIFQVPFSCLKF